MMKSKKKVILVGEEHSDTSHMQKIAELVISQLQNNQKVIVALEQNCGFKTIEDLSNVSIPGARARSKVVQNHPNFQSNSTNDQDFLKKISIQGNLDEETKKIYIGRFTNIEQEIAKEIDVFCNNMQFQANKNKLDYMNSMKRMAQYAYTNKKELQFISVDTEDEKPEKDTVRDISMYKNIICFGSDIVIYPVGSAHIHDENDSGNRLAALLIKDSNIELELANLYAENNKFAYTIVQQDIGNFKKTFDIENTVIVHNTKQEALDKYELSLFEEIKVKDEVVLKKPIFKVYKEFKGSNSINDHGLILEDIEYNLKKISYLQQSIAKNEIKLSDKVTSVQAIPSEISQWLLLNNNVDEKTSYISVVEITDIDKHHACVLRAMLRGKTLYINIIDPLSEEDSLFKNQLEKLKSSLKKTLAQSGCAVQCDIIYKGLQDSDYATCGDVCLIMVEELIYTQSVKYGNEVNAVLNYSVQSINGTSLNDSGIHNSDYDKLNVEAMGESYAPESLTHCYHS